MTPQPHDAACDFILSKVGPSTEYQIRTEGNGIVLEDNDWLEPGVRSKLVYRMRLTNREKASLANKTLATRGKTFASSLLDPERDSYD